MNLLMYYVLRRFFIKLRFSDNEISLEKGLIIKRVSVMPLSSAVKATSRRTLIMRLIRAKEITVFTLGGKIVFYLSVNEHFPLLPENRFHGIKPRFSDVMFGAFIDTRALSGLFLFTAVLRKFNAIFGSEYFYKLIHALTKTADELEKILGFFRVTAPRILVTVAVFTLGAWTFAYIRKLINLCRFCVSKNSGLLFVKSGVLTLYEHALVLNSALSTNNAAMISCGTVTTLISRRAPLYFRGVMICPCVRRRDLSKTLKALCGETLPQDRLVSPKRAFLGHIAAPLSWFGIFAALIVLTYCSDRSVMLLKTVLYSGAIVNLYTAVLYLLYMRRSWIALGKDVTAMTARRGLRLYTAVFPNDVIRQRAVSQSLFQRRPGLCNVKLALVERGKITVRQLPNSEYLRRIPFRQLPRRAPPNL